MLNSYQSVKKGLSSSTRPIKVHATTKKHLGVGAGGSGVTLGADMQWIAATGPWFNLQATKLLFATQDTKWWVDTTTLDLVFGSRYCIV